VGERETNEQHQRLVGEIDIPSDALLFAGHPVQPARESGLEPLGRAVTWPSLGSGLVDHSQKSTVAARAMAEKKTVGQRS